jgi:serine/threonine protein phosphatase PrpC
VQELIDAGQLTELAARSHPERNVITRAVGAEELVDADVWLLPIGGAQSFILCSDGLTKELDDTAIARLLAEYGSDSAAIPAETIADALVEAANRAGGKDNITVVVLDSSVEGAHLDDDNTNERTLMAAHLEETRPRA